MNILVHVCERDGIAKGNMIANFRVADTCEWGASLHVNHTGSNTNRKLVRQSMETLRTARGRESVSLQVDG